MNQPRHEPLTPEERELAERLARLGPHDGPSPALDAKILAAAHAAVAAPPRRKRRWLALSAVPGGLVTGVGMAAALALVVGVVWQLRPSSTVVYAPQEMAADAGTVSAEMIRRPRPQPPAPPPPEAEAARAAAQAPAPQKELRPPVAVRRQAPQPASAAAANEAAPEADMPSAWALDDDLVEAPAPAAPAGYIQRRAPAAREAAAAAMPPPPAAPAYAPAPSAAAAQSKAAIAADASTADAAAPVAEERASTLDRVEVTGSRIAYGDLPVHADAELAAGAWLDRIRARRDDGDLDGARASLALFRQQHPHYRVPRDLRALIAAEPAR